MGIIGEASHLAYLVQINCCIKKKSNFSETIRLCGNLSRPMQTKREPSLPKPWKCK